MKTIPVIVCLLLSLIVPHTTKAAFVNSETESRQTTATGVYAQLVHCLQAVANISRKQLEEFTGRHLSLAERVIYNINRRHFRNELKKAENSEVALQQVLQSYLSTTKGSGGRTILLVLIILLLLLLLVPLVLIGKWN